ncbi:B12-binding domain-containing radical SAM protein [Streptomyces sp. TS71-3]|uniref:B12-binding domain-containing radical SAM protein n=1 Tax=Streptomyces sp. TS71-3 TaxID=2733862 RepID=UPI001BB44899|nr:radical SAM protein [Streptomyces sp. TS71-3]
MMRTGLISSMHLNHGGMSLHTGPGDPMPMQTFVPVGLLSLKAAADSTGVPAAIDVVEVNRLLVDGTIPNTDALYDDIAAAALAAGDDLVGLMTDADSLTHTVLIGQAVKRRSPETLVCLGGPAVTPISAEFVERFPWADFIVRGEGELTFAELLRTLHAGGDPADVRGLTYRRKGEAVVNPERPLVKNMAELPWPAYYAFDMTTDANLYLDVGRGCPFKCSFCATAPFWERRFRMRPIDDIVRQMEYVRKEFGRTSVNFSHDIFTCDRNWTHRFCDELIARDTGVTWGCSTRTDVIDAGLLEKMGAAGCEEIYYGIESGSPRMQRWIKKNLDLDHCLEIVRATKAAGIRPVTGFIVGYPTETRETFDETLTRFFQFLREGEGRSQLFTLVPLHQSPMYKTYEHTLDRQAEYYDAPVTESRAARIQQYRAEHKDIFCTDFRFASPDIDGALVDAAEELSGHVVVLASLWPRLLAHYDSPLDWYERWVRWIERYNAEHSPGTRYRHQCEPRDLLVFAQEETRRLGIEDSPVGALVRYEMMRLDAAGLPAPGPRPNASTVGPDSALRPGDFLGAQFPYDLQELLRGEPTRQDPDGGAYVVTRKSAADKIETIQLGRAARGLLERADGRRTARELIAEVFPESADDDPQRALDRGLDLIRSLAGLGLLLDGTANGRPPALTLAPEATAVEATAVDGTAPRRAEAG